MCSIVISIFNTTDVDMFNSKYKEKCEVSKEIINRYFGNLCFF